MTFLYYTLTTKCPHMLADMPLFQCKRYNLKNSCSYYRQFNMSKVGNKLSFIPINVALVIMVTCHTERVAMVTQIYHLALVGQECNVDLLQSLDEL